MIITNKQFPNYRKFEMMYEGRPLTMEVGKLAELCNAAVLVKYGETTVLVTCTASARPKDGIDYFPLAVDFNEKLYAVGRIPGSFMRREGAGLPPHRPPDAPALPLRPQKRCRHRLRGLERRPRLQPRDHRHDRRLRRRVHLRCAV